MNQPSLGLEWEQRELKIMQAWQAVKGEKVEKPREKSKQYCIILMDGNKTKEKGYIKIHTSISLSLFKLDHEACELNIPDSS